MERKILITILQELCEEMNIKMEKLSYGWILQLSKEGKVRHILDYLFDNNPMASGKIVADKYATYEVLQSQNIPIIKYTMVFNPSLRGELIPKEGIWNIVVKEFEKYGKLVIKPNEGSTGKGIKLCQNIKEVEIAIENLFNQQHKSVSICPYYEIKTEYRTFYLNGEILLIYKKTKPFVIGNGKTTLRELIEKLQLPDKEIVEENLRLLDLNYVPKEGEKIEISWKHNLSGGAKPEILQKGEWYKKVEEIAIRAGKAMNMNFTTIDIIQTVDNKLYVMEMNSGVCGDIFAQTVEGGYEKMKEIYRKALKAMFE